MRILSKRYSPPFMLAPEGAGGGGGGGEPSPDGPVGGTFAALARQLKSMPEGGEAGEGGEGDPAPAEPPAPAPPTKPAPAPVKEKPVTPPKEVKKGAASSVPADVFKDTPATPPDAPAKEAPPAPEPPEINRDDLTKGMSDGARNNFKKLEEHYTQKVSKLQAELEAAKKLPVQDPAAAEETKTLKSELERLRAEHAEVLKTVELIGVERSPKFQQKFVAGRNKLIEDAARRVAKVGGDPDKFKAALELDGRAKYSAVQDALNDAPDFIAMQVATIVSQIESLDEERAEAMQNAKGKLSEWGEEETARQREENTKLAAARESRFAELLPEFAKECIFLRRVPEGTEGGEQWNKIVEEVGQGAKDFLFTATGFDDFAGAAVKARAYDKLQPLFLKVREENSALMEQIQQLTASEPGASSGSGVSGGNGESGENLSFAERVKKGMDSPGG